jgi:rhodanese-related sulfurtransferase
MIALLKALFGAGGPHLGPREAVQYMNRGAVLVDVREPGEFVAGHVAGAIHVPLGRIRAQGPGAIAALPDAGCDVLLVCQGGMRSRLAQGALSKDTGRRYINVDGGMSAWAASGLPIVRGP